MTLHNTALVMTLKYVTKLPQLFPHKHWGWIRLGILLSLDCLVVFCCYFLAFLLRFETAHLGDQMPIFLQTYWIYIFSYLTVFYLTGMYRQIWRFANLHNAILIVLSTLLACVVSFGIVRLLNQTSSYPRSVPVIVWSLSALAIGLVRFSWRGVNNLQTRVGKEDSERCFIYGAGGSGELMARYIDKNSKLTYKILGFIDDNPEKIGRKIHGYKVLGPGEALARLAKEKNVSSILIAMNSLPGKVIRDAIERCHKIGLKPMMMPELSSSMDGDKIRPRHVDVKDLLRRSQKSIDNSSVNMFFSGKVVLVTGAGGTIGSEISRQILVAGPAKLILLDSSELSLYTLENELASLKSNSVEVKYVMASVTDIGFIEKLFAREKIDCVLHVAAYKHVHLVEANPLAGVKNNIFGTRVLADFALQFDVKHFLLISSDKAVNPTGVMGKTKRICELYLQAMSQRHGNKCKFCSVRFGNVLGSSGSVIPRFLDQIASGGPVTVTHPDMTRYFMLVNEAVSLVLQSLLLTNGGELFVLKMGDPVNIYQMAKQLIELSGKKLGEDIDIVLTGLRPGEKLFEELSYEGTETRTEHEDILIVHPSKMNVESTLAEFEMLLSHAEKGEAADALALLNHMVNESFAPRVSEPLSLQCEEPAIPWKTGTSYMELAKSSLSDYRVVAAGGLNEGSRHWR